MQRFLLYSSYHILYPIVFLFLSYILFSSYHILTSPHCFPFKNMPTLLSHDNLCLYSFNIQIRQVVSRARHTFISKLYSIFDIDNINHPGRSSCESSDHSWPRHPQGQHQRQLQQGARQDRWRHHHWIKMQLAIMSSYIICIVLVLFTSPNPMHL